MTLGRAWVFVVLCAPLLAHAQFDKTPWPRSQATPKMDVVDVQGQRWTSADLKGRVVVLNFWATWCGPCKEEMPSLQALHKGRVDGQSDATAQHLDLPVVLDAQGDLTRQWGVRIYPTTVLIGPDGQARWRVVGEVDWNGPISRAWLHDLRVQPVSQAVRHP